MIFVVIGYGCLRVKHPKKRPLTVPKIDIFLGTVDNLKHIITSHQTEVRGFFMKIKRYQKLEVVADSNPQIFQDKVNAILERLAGEKYDLQLFNNQNGLSAFISYEVTERTPESLKDEYDLKGVTFVCKDCPFYEAVNTYEGVCPHCKGVLRRTDDVGNCNPFWTWLEEKDVSKRYQVLRDEIKRQFKRLYLFSEYMGVNNGYMSRKLSGQLPFTMQDKVDILDALGLELNKANIIKYFLDDEREHENEQERDS